MTMVEEPSSLGQNTPMTTILIVEDDTGIGEFLQRAIELETHYHALVAKNCTHALEIVQHVKPDLFLLDYYLGKMTGIDLYNLLHTLSGLEDIPAIILSASLSKHVQEIDDHHLIGMSKPVDLDELLATITKLLEAQNENTRREPM